MPTFFFFSIKHRARIKMILNIFQDWLGGLYINSSGLIRGFDIYTLVVVLTCEGKELM